MPSPTSGREPLPDARYAWPRQRKSGGCRTFMTVSRIRGEVFDVLIEVASAAAADADVQVFLPSARTSRIPAGRGRRATPAVRDSRRHRRGAAGTPLPWRRPASRCRCRREDAGRRGRSARPRRRARAPGIARSDTSVSAVRRMDDTGASSMTARRATQQEIVEFAAADRVADRARIACFDRTPPITRCGTR